MEIIYNYEPDPKTGVFHVTEEKRKLDQEWWSKRLSTARFTTYNGVDKKTWAIYFVNKNVFAVNTNSDSSMNPIVFSYV